MTAFPNPPTWSLMVLGRVGLEMAFHSHVRVERAWEQRFGTFSASKLPCMRSPSRVTFLLTIITPQKTLRCDFSHKVTRHHYLFPANASLDLSKIYAECYPTLENRSEM